MVVLPGGRWPLPKRWLMTAETSKQITQLLARWERGDPDALNELTPVVYNELHRTAHRYMRREQPGNTLQTSALINEAYIRLIDQRQAHWQNRAHFFAIAATMMRHILVDRVRARGYAKRGANPLRVSLDEALAVSGSKGPDVIALDDALKDLEAIDPRKSRIVEMRFFGGLSLKETAEALATSIPTVEREWRSARAWLHKAMTAGHGHES